MAKEKAGKPKRSIRNRLPRTRAFKRYEHVKKPRFEESELRDNLELMLKIAWMVFLFGVFILAPLQVGAIYGPGWGVLAALLGIPIWATVGIGPSGCFSFLEWFVYIGGYVVIFLSVMEATANFLCSLLR